MKSHVTLEMRSFTVVTEHSTSSTICFLGTYVLGNSYNRGTEHDPVSDASLPEWHTIWTMDSFIGGIIAIALCPHWLKSSLASCFRSYPLAENESSVIEDPDSRHLIQMSSL